MFLNFQKNLILFFLLLFVVSAGGQTVQPVKVDELRQSDIRKAQEAIKDAGLSEQEAINLARQKGATEEQIRQFQQRLKENPGSLDSLTMTFPDSSGMEEMQKNELSVRKDTVMRPSRIFGYYLFNNKNLTFEPGKTIQTPKNYEIGIGDQIIINIWGNSQNNYQLEVTRDGQIIIPDVGPVYIAGLMFDEAKQRIRQRLTSIYADMGGNNPQTFAQINIGELRSVKVNLVGEVQLPGTYTVPATSTVFNALYLSGGPDSLGSFRNIKVIRDNKIYKTVDIYKFLVEADPSDNITLKDEDIVFIPSLQKRVSVNGEFKRTGLFEMKDNETLEQLIRFAGGFKGSSYLGQVQVIRETQSGMKIIDVSADRAGEVILSDGDSIYNGKIRDEYQNRLVIDGAVYRPGEYEWNDGITLFDLIQKAEGLKKDAFLNRGMVIRENPDKTTTNIPFDVEEIVTRTANIVLQPEDKVMIKSRFDLMEEQYIEVSGEVLSPGEFYFSEGMTLDDAIFLANGFTEGADSTFIEVARRLSHQEASVISDQLVHIFTFRLDRQLKLKNDDAAFVLKPFDQISVRQAPGFRNSGKVNVTGEVKYAGQYAISQKGQRISDLIRMAGGVTQYAFAEGATFQRTNPVLGVENIAISLNQILNSPGSQTDLFLRDGDRLFIPEFIQTVKVSGSVQNPFSLTYEEGKNLVYYIEKSGGYDTNALKRKVYIKYANGATASVKGTIVKRYPKVAPGSQIIVPAKPEKDNTETGRWLAIASTFSSIAVAIAAVFR
jgi:protein involved in polysaccharide export with SLBB domain